MEFFSSDVAGEGSSSCDNQTLAISGIFPQDLQDLPQKAGTENCSTR